MCSATMKSAELSSSSSPPGCVHNELQNMSLLSLSLQRASVRICATSLMGVKAIESVLAIRYAPSL